MKNLSDALFNSRFKLARIESLKKRVRAKMLGLLAMTHGWTMDLDIKAACRMFWMGLTTRTKVYGSFVDIQFVKQIVFRENVMVITWDASNNKAQES